MNITIAGGGAFGTALANSLKKEHKITIHTRNKQVIHEINCYRKNISYFPNKVLSKQIKASDDLTVANQADFLFLCIPSHAIVSYIKLLNLNSNCIIINGSKGFGDKDQLIPEIISHLMKNKIASLKGPSFANELIFELPTSFTIATSEPDTFEEIKSLFRTEVAIFDYSSDIKGVEVLSILKNIYAIIVGIVDAYYNSPNVRFLVFAKALNEIKAILEFLNIPNETLFRYAGIGDFGLTSLNDLSRNRTLGLLIGKGFFGKNPGNPVVLEGVKAIEHFAGKIDTEQQYDLKYIRLLQKLLNNETNVKDFVNKVIYT